MLTMTAGLLGIVWAVRNYIVDAVALVLVGFFLGCVSLLLRFSSVRPRDELTFVEQTRHPQGPFHRLCSRSSFPQRLDYVYDHRPWAHWLSGRSSTIRNCSWERIPRLAAGRSGESSPFRGGALEANALSAQIVCSAIAGGIWSVVPKNQRRED
jgi:hypothetical protein